MNAREKERLTSLQQQLTIAKRALEYIAYGGNFPVTKAEDALEQILLREMDKKHAMDSAS